MKFVKKEKRKIIVFGFFCFLPVFYELQNRSRRFSLFLYLLE